MDTALDNGTLSTTLNKSKLMAEDLSKRWGISLEAAANTINNTTQRGIRTVANPTISQRFRTNDQQLGYRRIMMTLFTDTGFLNTLSR